MMNIAMTIVFCCTMLVALWHKWEFTALAFGLAALVVGCDAAYSK